MRVYRTYAADSALSFTIEKHAATGSILCCRQFQGRIELNDIRADRAAADAWLSTNPGGVLLLVQEDGSRTVIAGEIRAA